MINKHDSEEMREVQRGGKQRAVGMSWIQYLQRTAEHSVEVSNTISEWVDQHDLSARLNRHKLHLWGKWAQHRRNLKI